MNQVCAVVDIQGFSLQDGFRTRELAIWNDDTKVCFDVDPELCMFFLNKTDRRTVKYSTHNLHGLLHESFEDNAPKSKDLGKLLEMAYLTLIRPDKKLFGIKNTQLAEILDQYDIPYIELSTLEIVYKREGFCINHTELCPKRRHKYRCALRKTESLWTSLKIHLAREV